MGLFFLKADDIQGETFLNSHFQSFAQVYFSLRRPTALC